MKKLLQCRWWEGPDWLKKTQENWPQPEVNFNEQEINMERRKTIVSSMLNNTSEHGEKNWYYKYFSQYKKIIRMVGWLYRFRFNCMNKNDRVSHDLKTDEFNLAEKKVLFCVQEEVFKDINDTRLKSLLPFVD